MTEEQKITVSLKQYLEERFEAQTDRIGRMIRDYVSPIDERLKRIEQEHAACAPLRAGFQSTWKTVIGVASKLLTGAVVLALLALLRLLLKPEILAALQKASGL